MTNEVSNDNVDASLGSTPDPHGQAAILLIESLIHGLIARSVISVAEAIEIVEIASEVSLETAAPRDVHNTQSSATLLNAIATSLKVDLFKK